ncbi:MAG: isoleucine--tRNA ligase [Spirochaetia bacterium]|nr:isoleucine--tRNA ligase [Spirochaetia bacterium]
MAAAGPAVTSVTAVERLICAKKLEAALFADRPRKVVKTLKGSDLAGTHYKPLFNFIKPDASKKSHYVIAAHFVTMDTGTGIVHIAPAYGADDLEAGRQNDLPVIHAVGLDGRFVEGTAWAGEFFKDADPHIIRALKERGLVFKSERYKHEYPFGWRTGAPLLYFAKEAWYIRTTSVRDALIQNNQSVRWVPDHVKEGRFGNWLENNRDWALSRERYWGTPLPVWMDEDGNSRIIGSAAELEELSGQKLSGLDLHRPFIDRITFQDKVTGKTFRRVPEVIDCWFDSGAMPYAQWGWPVRGKEAFAKAFPAEFISEAVDQTRGWFYTLLAISTMVSDSASYKNVVCLGHVLDAKGEKMSKSKGNTVDPESVFASHGADAIRWYFLTGAPPGNSRRVGRPGEAGDPVVNVHGLFNMILNSAGFFALYANVDKVTIGTDWLKDPVRGAPAFAERPELDRWILSRLQVLIRDVTESLLGYDAQKAGRLIEEFMDGLSNWYIRRNRRRFWKGDLSGDKLAAYDTLHRCLVTVSRLMAPFTPFLAEDVFRSLVSETESAGAPESVHLSGWPQADFQGLYDAKILADGDLLQNAAFLGRAARMQSGVKVRQPLQRIMVHVPDAESRDVIRRYQETLLDELNVKELEFLDDSSGILEYRVKPNLPRLGKRLGSRLREVQEFFRAASAREVAANVRALKSTWIGTGEDAIELEHEDILVESSSKEGTSGAEGGGLFVALDTTLNKELIQEGLVRDLVRNVQELRKKSELNVTDRISLKIDAPDDIRDAVQSFASYIEGEVLGRLAPGSGVPSGAQSLELDGKPVQIAIWKV